MSTKITASVDTLIKQASWTANDYFRAAIQRIDDEFGEGYAKAHPELIGAFMQTAAGDFQTSITVQVLQEIAETLRDDIASSLREEDFA